MRSEWAFVMARVTALSTVASRPRSSATVRHRCFEAEEACKDRNGWEMDFLTESLKERERETERKMHVEEKELRKVEEYIISVIGFVGRLNCGCHLELSERANICNRVRNQCLEEEEGEKKRKKKKRKKKKE